jgi:hypothetical protein
MRHIALALALLVLGSLSPSSARAADDTGKLSLGAINKALDAIRKDAAGCKTAALNGFKDARDILETAKGRPSVDTFTRARRAVEDAFDASSDACAAPTQQAMQDALKVLRDNVDTAATKAAEPTPQQKKTVEMRQCWNYKNDWTAVDPACYAPREGNYPLSKIELDKILAKMQRADDRFDKSNVLEKEIGPSSKRFLSCAQLAVLIRGLANDADRTEAVKSAAGNLIDFGNSGVALAVIADRQFRSDAAEAIDTAAKGAE